MDIADIPLCTLVSSKSRWLAQFFFTSSPLNV